MANDPANNIDPTGMIAGSQWDPYNSILIAKSEEYKYKEWLKGDWRIPMNVESERRSMYYQMMYESPSCYEGASGGVGLAREKMMEMTGKALFGVYGADDKTAVDYGFYEEDAAPDAENSEKESQDGTEDGDNSSREGHSASTDKDDEDHSQYHNDGTFMGPIKDADGKIWILDFKNGLYGFDPVELGILSDNNSAAVTKFDGSTVDKAVGLMGHTPHAEQSVSLKLGSDNIFHISGEPKSVGDLVWSPTAPGMNDAHFHDMPGVLINLHMSSGANIGVKLAPGPSPVDVRGSKNQQYFSVVVDPVMIYLYRGNAVIPIKR